MLLKTKTDASVVKTFDMNKFGCVLLDGTTIFVCENPGGPLFSVATLSNVALAELLYDDIIRKWAFGEYLYDVRVWLNTNCT